MGDALRKFYKIWHDFVWYGLKDIIQIEVDVFFEDWDKSKKVLSAREQEDITAYAQEVLNDIVQDFREANEDGLFSMAINDRFDQIVEVLSYADFSGDGLPTFHRNDTQSVS